jgi:M6 family metalloprotease-like protein
MRQVCNAQGNRGKALSFFFAFRNEEVFSDIVPGRSHDAGSYDPCRAIGASLSEYHSHSSRRFKLFLFQILPVPANKPTEGRKKVKRTTNITDVAFVVFALGVALSSTVVAFPVMQPSTGPYAANPNPPQGHAIGPKQVLIIRVQFSDAAETTTQSAIESIMATVAQFYQKSSFGRVTLTTTVTSQVYTLPQSSAYYVTRATISDCLTALMDDAIAAAATDYAVDQTGGNWDRVGVCYATIPNVTGQKISGDYGSYGTKFFWITTPQAAGIINHEIGHTFGARHASLWQVTDGDPVSPNGTSVEYQDTFDVMGASAGYNSKNADFSEWRKWQWGWIDDSQVAVISAPGIYQFRIFRFHWRPA